MIPPNEKERTPHTMKVARQVPTSEHMARTQISNLSESHPMVVPAKVEAIHRIVIANEDCEVLRPTAEAYAMIGGKR